VRTGKGQYSHYWFSGDVGTYTLCLATVLVLISIFAGSIPHYDAPNVVSTTLSVTTSFRTIDIATTTGYATTEVSTTEQTAYATEVVRSYGTITATQYIYLESSVSNSSPNAYSTTPGNDLLNPGLVVALTNGQLPDSRLSLLLGSGAVVLILVSVLVLRRRRLESPTESGVSSLEMDEKNGIAEPTDMPIYRENTPS